MLDSPVHLIRSGGVITNEGNGGVILQPNIKNSHTASPELGSSSEELAEAENAWESVLCVEPKLASSHTGTNSTNTLEKQHLDTPTPPSTPSLVYGSNATTGPTVATIFTSSFSNNKCSSPSQFSLQENSKSHQHQYTVKDEKLQQQTVDFLQASQLSRAECTNASWSPDPLSGSRVESYQYQQPPLLQPHHPYPAQPLSSYASRNGSVCSLVPSGKVKVTPTIDFDEVWGFFTRQDMTHVKTTIRPCLEKRGVPGLLRSLFGPRKLRPELVSERDLIFCIAQCPLSNSEPLHLQMLQTVYRRLTGSRTDCPRYGPHWDIIGFQGSDPATDLRGVGLLGLVQMVALVTGENSQHLAADVFVLSHDTHSQFPLMVLCLNVTRIVLQALREGCLNKECNSRGNVRHVLNEFFAAVLYHIYHIWRTEKKCITDSGYLIKDAEYYCKGNVRSVLQTLQVHLRSFSSQHFV